MKKFTSGLIFGLILPTCIIPLLDAITQYIINIIAIKSSKQIKEADVDDEEDQMHLPQIGFSIEDEPDMLDDDDDDE